MPEQFGPYVVYERIGMGGMATVHRASRRGISGFEKPVALKRMLPSLANEPARVHLFVREAKLAARLNHGNIAQTYSLGSVGDIFYIAMELVKGPSISDLMRAVGGPMPVHITMAIMDQVCDALDYAHNLADVDATPLGIIHRDVTPSNIMVSESGAIKLIDFGIAKVALEDNTQTGVIKGKLRYVAPEYLDGTIDARADIYAVGVLAHEMLAGRPLFKGENDFETLANVRGMRVEPPSRWNRGVPADLDDIILTALQRNPDERWQNASAMRVALQRVMTRQGIIVSNQEIAAWATRTCSPAPQPQPRPPQRELDAPATVSVGFPSIEIVRHPSVTPSDDLLPFHGQPESPSGVTTNVVVTKSNKRPAPRWQLIGLIALAVTAVVSVIWSFA